MDTLFQFHNATSTFQLVGCHFGIKPQGWSYPKHHHHLYELSCCMEGGITQNINGIEVSVEAGDWLLLKPGVKHSLHNTSPFHYAFFNFHFDIDDLGVRNRLGAAPFLIIPSSPAEESRLPGLLQQCEAMMHKGSWKDGEAEPESRIIELAAHEHLALQGYIMLIIHEVIVLANSLDSHPDAAGQQASAYELDIAHAVEHRLSQSLSEAPSISELAKQLNLSRSQLSKIFSKVYGLSPRQYLSRRKWNNAKELLTTTNLTVYSIAEQLGFRSVNHFSRQFRRWVGVSPNQYRRSKTDGPQV
ncbi:AraC family transcriptional regulator [Paenibacillus chungangensis]|uniref:Helix-turn-helix domain-containing protein n=1 Tax=Paenibacillus chungangensis TaxID=696535 RepID=A0ABW3HSQ6_9BACL